MPCERLTVDGVLDSLQPIGEFVVRAALAAGLDRKPAYRLRLAVDEIATNVITHGYEAAGLSGELTVEAHLTDTALTVVLEDAARPFDPRTHRMPEAELEKPLRDRKVGGLGVFLALAGVDGFDYQSAQGRNRSLFTVRRPDAGRA